MTTPEFLSDVEVDEGDVDQYGEEILKFKKALKNAQDRQKWDYDRKHARQFEMVSLVEMLWLLLDNLGVGLIYGHGFLPVMLMARKSRGGGGCRNVIAYQVIMAYALLWFDLVWRMSLANNTKHTKLQCYTAAMYGSTPDLALHIQQRLRHHAQQ